MIELSSAYERLGEADCTFRCCDTSFRVDATGIGADRATAAGRQTAQRLESQLDAFDPDSAVSQLNDEGRVRNEHVARIVRRGLEYLDRTDGVFDIRQGRVERDLKAYLRGDSDSLPAQFDAGTVTVDGASVETGVPLDLNGLAKGYIVDRAARAVDSVGRRGFVSGGGDLSPPTGPIAVESPYGDETPLRILDTDWSVATSGTYRRERDGVDHIYDPAGEELGARRESVTVVARRDCMEADALATALSALPLGEANALAERWDGLEALLVQDGVFHQSSGFEEHVLDR